MKKKRLEKLVLNRETLRELSVEESRKVVGGDDDDGGLSVPEASCNVCEARRHLPIG